MFEKAANKFKRNLFACLFVFRLCNSFLMTTIFEPDEIWPCLEPIHYMMFGKGTMTWDWMTGIRSYNFVLLYHIPQYILYLLYKDRYYLYCHYGYKTTNALLSAICDYYTIQTYKILHKNTNPIIFLTLFSHALWLYSPRSHINSLEMLFFVIVMYNYTKSIRSKDVSQEKRYFTLSVLFTTVIVYMRPTALFFVVFLYKNKIRNVLYNILYIAVPTAALICTDSYVYNEFVIPPFNFFLINVYYKVSTLFGTQPFYLHAVFLFVLTGALLPLAVKHAIQNEVMQKPKDDKKTQQILKYINRNAYRNIAACCLVYFVCYSLQKHKEMRFLLPLVPFVNILSAKNMNKKVQATVLLSFFVSIYIGMTHQRYDHVMSYVRKESAKNAVNALFCVCPYSLPAYSYLCKNDLTITFPTQNPDVYSLVTPHIYKKFGDGFVAKEYDKFVTSGYKTYNFDQHNLIVIYDVLYDKMKKQHLQNFVIVKKCKYADIVLEKEKSKMMYVLKRY